MASVQGIGGVFIESDNAERLARWYADVLGIAMETHPNAIGYYHVFQTRDVESSIVRENPVFAINHSSAPLAVKGRGYMLNLRVDDLHAFLAQLRAHGVAVEERIQEWERGRHAWIRDPDGNRIELYEELFPND